MTSLTVSGALRHPPAASPWLVHAVAVRAAVARTARSLAGAARKRHAQAAERRTQDSYAAHREALWQKGDAMIASARERGEALSVLMFDQVDLPELHALFGGSAARSVVSKFNQKVLQLAGTSGLPVRCGPTTWTLLLPHASQEAAIAELRSVFGAGLAVEGDGSELLLVPRIAVRTIGDEQVTIRQLHQAMAEEIQCVHQRDLRRQRPAQRRAAQA